ILLLGQDDSDYMAAHWDEVRPCWHERLSACWPDVLRVVREIPRQLAQYGDGTPPIPFYLPPTDSRPPGPLDPVPVHPKALSQGTAPLILCGEDDPVLVMTADGPQELLKEPTKIVYAALAALVRDFESGGPGFTREQLDEVAGGRDVR